MIVQSVHIATYLCALSARALMLNWSMSMASAFGYLTNKTELNYSVR